MLVALRKKFFGWKCNGDMLDVDKASFFWSFETKSPSREVKVIFFFCIPSGKYLNTREKKVVSSQNSREQSLLDISKAVWNIFFIMKKKIESL